MVQPPEIRHRVLESSVGLEVLELGSPAGNQCHVATHRPRVATLSLCCIPTPKLHSEASCVLHCLLYVIVLSHRLTTVDDQKIKQ